MIKKCKQCKTEFDAQRSDAKTCSAKCRVAYNRRRKKVSVYHRANKDEWETPENLFDELDQEFGFSLDVAATSENSKCNRYYDAELDGLSQSWQSEVCWCNPPYSQIALWMQKAYEESLGGAVVVCLIPARTDTSYWHDYATRGEIRFFRGRLKFSNSKNPAPFPSALVVFRNLEERQVV